MPRTQLPTLPDAPQPRREERGVDISKWQDPARLDWRSLKKMCEFVLCRATRGSDRDERLEQHVELARRHGLCLGVYHSFRLRVAAQVQLNAFAVARESVGYEPGDLVPCLSLEDDPGLREVSPAWSEPARLMCGLLVEAYGEAMPYVSPAVYLALGSPAWMRARPIAVAGSAPISGFRALASGEWTIVQQDETLEFPTSSLAVSPEFATRAVRVPHRAPRVSRSGGWDREPLSPEPDAARGVTVA